MEKRIGHQKNGNHYFKTMAKLRAYKASDYAGLDAGAYHFYFGYEEKWCKLHKRDGSKCPERCDELYWIEDCFVVRKGKKIIMRIQESELGKEVEDFANGLVLGIGHFILKNKWQN